MAADRLSLLCRKTRVLPAQVFQLVRDYLLVHVGASCPMWLNHVLKDKVRALPRSLYRRISVSFHVSQTIEYDVYRQDDYEYGRTYPQHRVPRREPVQVNVQLRCCPDNPGLVRWWLSCWQGDYLLRHGEGIWVEGVISTFLSELSEIRSRFDESEPCGSMEVPTTWRDWRRFIRLWLFGPPARRPMLELQRIPVAGELCRDCGKTSTPATRHPVHMLGEAFCSQQCAKAYMVLSCSRCHEPLIEGQGLCGACPA